MSQTVTYQLDHLLNEILYREIAHWLQPKLEAIYGADVWWRQGVYENLSNAQKRRRRNPDQGDLSELDLQALLHVVSKIFGSLVDQCEVSWDLHTPLKSVRDARNALSHRRGGQSLDPEDLLLHALNTKKLLSLIGASDDAIDSAGKVVKAITDPEPETIENATLGDLLGTAPDDIVAPGDAGKEAHEHEEPSQEKPEDVQERELNVPDDANVDLSRVPLPGMNRVITARLKTCSPDSAGRWMMGLVVASYEGKEQHFTLSVPAYLAESANAAADILKSCSQRDVPPPVYVKLLNAFFSDDTLQFPDDPKQNEDAYPLLVVQPSYLINVTALTHFDYCPRNYLINRYSIPESNQAMQRGTLVHSVFDFMLRNPSDRKGLIPHCHAETDRQLTELTMQRVPVREHYEDVRPHLNALAGGVAQALNPASFQEIYMERYMINPDLGLKGKIDALVKKTNGRWHAIELKTGKSWGAKANDGHAFQVCAYHLLLSQTGIGQLDPPVVVYTGNQAKRMRDGDPLFPAAAMVKTLTFTAATAIKMINLRNELVRIDFCGHLDFNANENKCRACVRSGKASHCVTLHGLGMSGGDSHSVHIEPLVAGLQVPEQYQEQFRDMNRALCEEFQAIRIEHGQLLQGSMEDRIAQGVSLCVRPSDDQTGGGELRLEFPGGNSSEFREGDPCLLSDAKGPVDGNCAEVYISRISKKRAVVSLPQGIDQFWFEPAYLDVNAPDSAFERNFAALYALWAGGNKDVDTLGPVRSFLAGEPDGFRANEEADFEPGDITPSPLPAQLRAVRLARGMKDVLLVQGPPGTGKTYTLALAVKALVDDGQCVAIATYTHRAADEVMSKLLTLAPDFEVRKLGRPESVASQYTDRCLDRLVARDDECEISDRKSMLDDLESQQESVKGVLGTPAVYLGTTHAWLSGKYDALPGLISNGEKALFDVVIVDEASQVITPNLVGVLRLAPRWILVGDHKQLPPIVVGDKSGLLEKTLFESIAEYPGSNDNLLVQLDTQHRFPDALANFIGDRFYGGKLVTSDLVASRNETVVCKHPRVFEPQCIALFEAASTAEEEHPKQFVEEAKWIANMLDKLNQDDWPFRDEKNKPTIGIIAPYRAQVALLRRSLENRFEGLIEHEFWNNVVDTVDRFQGDQRDIIILSLCLKAGTVRPPRIYEDERRINVALTRAKLKLWVVGCIDEMQSIPVFRAFKDYAAKHPEACKIVRPEKSSLSVDVAVDPGEMVGLAAIR